MATLQQKIRAATRFMRLQPEQLLATGYTVVNSLRDNANFPNVPVDPGVLQSALDVYADTIGVAKDGSRTAIALRNKQGEEIVQMLQVLASYAEFNCKGDMHIFLTSGFQPRPSSRALPQPLDTPAIDSIDQGMSGQLMVWIKGVRGTKTYELRFAPDSGVAAGAWSVQTVGRTKTAAAINGLTPGVVYVFQVRAFGSLGFTEWSAAGSRMCI